MVFAGLLLVKPSFSREKDGFSKDGCSKQSFSREKDGFEPKNHLFLEKTKKTKKTIFSKTMGLGLLSRDGFFFAEGLVLVKPSFSREKDGSFGSRKRWFLEEKTIFFSRKPKKPSFGGPSPIVLEKMVFLVFLLFWIFLVCWFLLVSCFVVFCLARTRLPSVVGALGGGVSIYIYMCIYVYIFLFIRYSTCRLGLGFGGAPRFGEVQSFTRQNESWLTKAAPSKALAGAVPLGHQNYCTLGKVRVLRFRG